VSKRNISKALAEIEARLDKDETLSATDREQIKEKAREHVAKQRRDKAEADYLKVAIREEERSYEPTEQYEDVLVNLAPYVAFVMLDGVMFYHGLTYSLPYGQARVLDDQCWRSWEHQNEIEHGRKRSADLSRRRVSRLLGPGDEGLAVGAPGQKVNTRSSLLNREI
jgi:hypothetical protein